MTTVSLGKYPSRRNTSVFAGSIAQGVSTVSNKSPMKSLRERWESGEATFGAWCTIPSSWTTELAARSGHDFVVIDTQHGLAGHDTMLPMLQGISAGGAASLVRVPWNDPAWIMKSLDAGAGGVIVPMINSRTEAEKAVGACRYPPAGFRSMGSIRGSVADRDWRDPLCVLMIETVEAVGSMDEILDVPGIDAVFVGPNDLALSAGLDSSYEGSHPEHRAMIEGIARAAGARRITAGIMCGTPEVARQWHAVGYRMLALASDTRLLADALNSIAERARSLCKTG